MPNRNIWFQILTMLTGSKDDRGYYGNVGRSTYIRLHKLCSLRCYLLNRINLISLIILEASNPENFNLSMMCLRFFGIWIIHFVLMDDVHTIFFLRTKQIKLGFVTRMIKLKITISGARFF